MSILEVKEVCKSYPGFSLDHVTFSMEPGKIMGFIGRNGAGKTTTLKSLLNIVHPDQGTIQFFNQDFSKHEFEIKQRIGFVAGGIDYYPLKKLRTITNVTKKFYTKWDETAYRNYMTMFKLDEKKTPAQLSAGMKVKYNLALALSHNAELLLLDEPTSGLDPVSRDDLLDIFLELADKGISILFSTHITSDLDKCADDITYIKSGKIIANMGMTDFLKQYKVVEYQEGQLSSQQKELLIGSKRSKSGFSALIKAQDVMKFNQTITDADLDSVMVHIEKE